MPGCDCRREHLKRRSMARPRRASSSMSASRSRVAATLRLRAAASAIVVSIWRLIAFRFSCCSFCSRVVIGFLSGFENEGVVFQQRDGIGNKVVEHRIAEPERWLRAARRPLLAQDIGDIVSTEGPGGSRLFDGDGHVLRTVLPYQFQQFRYLTAQRPVGIGHVAEVGLKDGSRTQVVE